MEDLKPDTTQLANHTVFEGKKILIVALTAGWLFLFC